MTSPTDVSPPPSAEPEGPGLSLRRTLRTASAESWDVVDAKHERAGLVTLQYGADAVEGVLAVPAETDGDTVRGLLAWVTDLLVLDAAAGPGGVIHWVVATGALEDFWRRSPGQRPTGAQQDVATARARVQQVLAGMFGEVTERPDGGFAVDAGSVRVFVSVRLMGDVVLVRVFSITNVGVDMDADLSRFLLGLNFDIAIGRFSLDEAQRAVWFDHVLAADELDDATLVRTVAAVAQTADRYDDEIKERFGGRTFREEGSPVEAASAEPGMAGGYL